MLIEEKWQVFFKNISTASYKLSIKEFIYLVSYVWCLSCAHDIVVQFSYYVLVMIRQVVGH